MDRTIRTRDGLDLQRRDWPSGDARGTIVIVHGLGEHIGRYAHVAARLNASRWSVVGYDQRGHGASPGERGRLAADDDLLADLAAVLDAVRARSGRAARPPRPQPRRPGRRALRRRRARSARACMAARRRRARPLVTCARRRHALGQRALLATLGPLTPNLAVGNGLDPAWISRDPAVVAAYRADPLVHDRIAPRLGRFIVDAGRVVRSLRAALAGADACCSTPAATAASARRQCRIRRGGAGGSSSARIVRVALPRDLQRARAGRGLGRC